MTLSPSAALVSQGHEKCTLPTEARVVFKPPSSELLSLEVWWAFLSEKISQWRAAQFKSHSTLEATRFLRYKTVENQSSLCQTELWLSYAWSSKSSGVLLVSKLVVQLQASRATFWKNGGKLHAKDLSRAKGQPQDLCSQFIANEYTIPEERMLHFSLYAY